MTDAVDGTDPTPEDEARIAIVRKTLVAFGRAIESKDWSTARALWAAFEPFYPDLFAEDPRLCHLEEVLKRSEAFAGPQVGGVH